MKKLDPLMLIVMYGGTTTKVAIYEGDTAMYMDTLRHSLEEMKNFNTVWEQYDVRKRDIMQWAESKGIEVENFDIFVSCSGLVKPCEPGVYEINEAMIEDCKTEKYGIHTSNPGCVLVYDMGKEYDKPVFTVDPTTDVNMMKIATYSGHPLIPRPNSYHVANQKATAQMLSEKLGKSYSETNIIVAHVGSGTTVGAHCKGKVIDVNNGIESDGPFSTVRTGALPVGPLVDLCFSGEYSRQDMHNMLGVQGGLAAYLGTSDGLEIEDRILAGDEEAKTAVESMAYQVAKEIGARAVTLRGDVDAIAITGGVANWKRVVDLITYWTEHIAPIHVYPGENELESLAAGVMRYYKGEEELKVY